MTTVKNTNRKRKEIHNNLKDKFYQGFENANELRKSKHALDKNAYLTNKRELRKNYDGRYLYIEFDSDQSIGIGLMMKRKIWE